jgi:hypothetical protein
MKQAVLIRNAFLEISRQIKWIEAYKIGINELWNCLREGPYSLNTESYVEGLYCIVFASKKISK